jgi:hypothetical protein
VLVSIYILAYFPDDDDFVDTAQDGKREGICRLHFFHGSGMLELKKKLNMNVKNVYNIR